MNPGSPAPKPARLTVTPATSQVKAMTDHSFVTRSHISWLPNYPTLLGSPMTESKHSCLPTSVSPPCSLWPRCSRPRDECPTSAGDGLLGGPPAQPALLCPRRELPLSVCWPHGLALRTSAPVALLLTDLQPGPGWLPSQDRTPQLDLAPVPQVSTCPCHGSRDKKRVPGGKPVWFFPGLRHFPGRGVHSR